MEGSTMAPFGTRLAIPPPDSARRDERGHFTRKKKGRFAMRTMAKLGAVSILAFMVACGSAGGGDDPTPAPGPVDPHHDPVGPVDDHRVADINALVQQGGDLTTDKKADAAPVPTSKQDSKQVVDGGTTFQCTTQNYSLTKVPSEFVLLSPNADVLWPGSLVQGKSMAAGVLDPIPVKRAPGTITLSIASSAAGQFSKKLDEPSLSSAIQAQNDILAGFQGKTPAMFSIEVESVFSNEQLAVAVDAQASGTTWSAAASLKIDTSSNKSHVLIKFSQQYYTMAFDPPQGPAGVFDPSVTAKDLGPYVGAGNPAVYVSSVTYGRIFYLMFESSESQTKLEAAVSGSYSGGAISANATASADWQNTINTATIKSYAIGGSAQSAIDAASAGAQYDKVLAFLKKGANFDVNNPGVPISYELRNLLDASEVRLALTTDYTAKNCEALAVGCDGVAGSGKVLDKCGVCGGAGNTCNPCAAKDFSYVQGNGAYVIFKAAAQTHGGKTYFPDGSYESYHFPTCRRVYWGNVTATCTNGSWSVNAPTDYDYDCVPADRNDGWSSNGNSIQTGYQP
jgi:thiol-activated cytolysin